MPIKRESGLASIASEGSPMKPITAGFILLGLVAVATIPNVACAGSINIPKASVPHITVPHVTTPKVNNGGKSTTSTNTNYSDQTNLSNDQVTSAQANSSQKNSQEMYNNIKQYQTGTQQGAQQIWQSHEQGYVTLKP